LRLKHERDAWLAAWLADLLIAARTEIRNELADAWVAPVPLHWRKRWSRGYNQADALSVSLARRLNLPLRPVLRRVVATPPLATLSRTQRSRLMRGAFRVQRSTRLRGRTVLLVDNILTTGATCGAAARALKQAGAARVVALVIGRAEGKP
jgi:ComF family protein